MTLRGWSGHHSLWVRDSDPVNPLRIGVLTHILFLTNPVRIGNLTYIIQGLRVSYRRGLPWLPTVSA